MSTIARIFDRSIYTITPAQQRMIDEQKAQDAKAEALSASLEQIAVEGMASVAGLSATDAATAELAGRNAELHRQLEQTTRERDKAEYEAQFNQITVTDQATKIRSLTTELGISREAHKGKAWAIARMSALTLASVWPDLEMIAAHDDNETSIYTRIERNATDGCEALLRIALGEPYLVKCSFDHCDLYGCDAKDHPDDSMEVPR